MPFWKKYDNPNVSQLIHNLLRYNEIETMYLSKAIRDTQKKQQH